MNRHSMIGLIMMATSLVGCESATKKSACPEFASLTISGQPIPKSFVDGIQLVLGENASQNQILEAAGMVRGKYAKATPDEIVDLLAAANCSRISGLISADDQKQTQLDFVERADSILADSPTFRE